MAEQLSSIEGMTDMEIKAALEEGRLRDYAVAKSKKQLTREDLETMSPDDIVKAHREGRLAELTQKGA